MLKNINWTFVAIIVIFLALLAAFSTFMPHRLSQETAPIVTDKLTGEQTMTIPLDLPTPQSAPRMEADYVSEQPLEVRRISLDQWDAQRKKAPMPGKFLGDFPTTDIAKAAVKEASAEVEGKGSFYALSGSYTVSMHNGGPLVVIH